MASEYVPGQCNIGARGRAIRLSTGGTVMAMTIGFGLRVLDPLSLRVSRILLAFPLYVGLLSILDGLMSF